ncbi:cell wall-binding repeat-containing protein [Clostridium sp. DJ247]|uniref:cell wall-binding repeat-containing protein n=1 Tax=Clostridium sp. DJ247 TaxID=2726188 RepID=UPI0016261666|nr:cell wall-binding repeat-containing protein [Clostridium sp. DJ247]MBC2579513.1 cell wall-binding repeat-containing protein [Clostridium sp. DJ247]
MKIKKLAALCAFLAIVGGNSIVSANESIAPESERLSGMNRYETAANVSKAGWKDGSDYAIIANGEEFADALCSVPLAKKYNAPVLLTESGNLSQATKQELERLKSKHVIIVGGDTVVSPQALSTISNSLSNKPDVRRIYGKDRFETSAKVAEELGAVDSAFITYGYNYADALSVSSIAAIKGIPILLTDKDALPDSVEKYISGKKISNSYIVGLQGVISNNVEDKLNKIEANPSTRLGGSNRYETNISVLKQFIKDINFDNVFVALGEGPTGKEFADALSGAALAAQKGAPMILTYSTMPQVTGDYLKQNVKSNTAAIIVGGSSVLPDSLQETVKDYIGDKQNSQQPSKTTNGSSGGGSISGGSSSGSSTNKFGTNPLVEVKGTYVIITYTDNSLQNSDVTVKVYSKGTSNYKYIDQSILENGICKFQTTLDRGSYQGELNVNGTNIQLPEFTVY